MTGNGPTTEVSGSKTQSNYIALQSTSILTFDKSFGKHNVQDAVLQRHEQTAQVLFLSTWSNSDWSAEDEQQAKGILESEMLPVNDLCLFTSCLLYTSLYKRSA